MTKTLTDYILYAQKSGMTPREFQKEIFTAAAAVGMTMIEMNGDEEMRFTCNDVSGPVELIVRKIQ